MGLTTSFIKARDHSKKTTNEGKDVLETGATEAELGFSIALDQDPEAVYLLYSEQWVEWDALVQNIVQ